MIVRRWQAPEVPTKEQMKDIFKAEGLEPFEELFEANTVIEQHMHPFDEVRMVAQGEMLLDINGNKLLLRAGDKIVVPSNTKHSKEVKSGQACLCICARKAY